MTVERRAEEPKNGAREGTGAGRNKQTRITGATITVANPGALGEEAVQPPRAHCGETGRNPRTFQRRAMSEFQANSRRNNMPMVQPPDAENRMSGGVGGWPGAIPVTRPDPGGPPYNQRVLKGVLVPSVYF